MKKRLIWIFLFLISVIAFWYKIPEDIQIGNTFVLAIIGSTLSFVFIAQAFGNFTNLKDVKRDTSEFKNKWYRKITPFFVLPAFIYFFVLGAHYRSTENSDLQTNGKITEAIVLSKRVKNHNNGWYGQHKSKSYFVKLMFSYDNEKVKKEYCVSEQSYNGSIIGDKVDIIYSQNKLSNIALLISDYDIKKFTTNNCRDLNIFDLLKIQKLKKDSTSKYLKQIHFNWRLKSNSENIWVNHNKFSLLNLEDKTTYIFPLNGNKDILQQIEKMCIYKVSKGKEEIFTFKKFNIVRTSIFANMEFYHKLEVEKRSLTKAICNAGFSG